MNSMDTLWDMAAFPAAAWLVTYLVHSTLLYFGARMASLLVSAPVRDVLWKVALTGGLLTASLQAAAGGSPLLNMGLPQGGETGSPALTLPARGDAAAAPLPAPRPAPAAADIASTGIPALSPPPLPAAAAAPGPALAAATPVRPGSRLQLLPWLWAAGALVFLARSVLLRRRFLSDLGEREDVTDLTLLNLTEGLRRKAGLRRGVRLTAAPRLATPVALTGREVCLPRRALAELSPRQQESMLAHELAHVKRRDPAWLTLSGLLESVLFMQPLTRLCRRQLQETSEELCDAWAVQQTGRGVTLARCLARVATWLESERRAAPVACMARLGSPLVRRIQHLLDGLPGPRDLSSRARLAVAAAPLLLVALLGPSVQAHTPETEESGKSVVGRSVTAPAVVTGAGVTGPSVVRVRPSTAPVISVGAGRSRSVRPPRAGGVVVGNPAGGSAYVVGSAPVVMQMGAGSYGYAYGDTTAYVAAGEGGVALLTGDAGRDSDPVESAIAGSGSSRSSSTSTSRPSNHDPFSGTRNMVYNDGERSWEVRTRGEVELSDDATEVISTSPDGLLQVEEDDGTSRRSVSVTSRNGELRYRYQVDGRHRTFDADGRAWLGRLLARVRHQERQARRHSQEARDQERQVRDQMRRQQDALRVQERGLREQDRAIMEAHRVQERELHESLRLKDQELREQDRDIMEAQRAQERELRESLRLKDQELREHGRELREHGREQREARQARDRERVREQARAGDDDAVRAREGMERAQELRERRMGEHQDRTREIQQQIEELRQEHHRQMQEMRDHHRRQMEQLRRRIHGDEDQGPHAMLAPLPPMADMHPMPELAPVPALPPAPRVPQADLDRPALAPAPPVAPGPPVPPRSLFKETPRPDDSRP